MPILTPTLIAALVSLVLGFGGGWVSNGWRLDASISQLKLENSQELTKGLQMALDKTNTYQRTKDEAIKKAELRTSLYAASDLAARTESDRLRNQLAEANGTIGKATNDSLVKYTTTLGGVLNECQAAITGLAEKATGHASDVQTLMDAWPKEPTR